MRNHFSFRTAECEVRLRIFVNKIVGSAFGHVLVRASLVAHSRPNATRRNILLRKFTKMCPGAMSRSMRRLTSRQTSTSVAPQRTDAGKYDRHRRRPPDRRMCSHCSGQSGITATKLLMSAIAASSTKKWAPWKQHMRRDSNVILRPCAESANAPQRHKRSECSWWPCNAPTLVNSQTNQSLESERKVWERLP